MLSVLRRLDSVDRRLSARLGSVGRCPAAVAAYTSARLRCVAESNAALPGFGGLGRVGRFPLLYTASPGATSRVRTSAVRLSLPWAEQSRGQHHCAASPGSSGSPSLRQAGQRGPLPSRRRRLDLYLCAASLRATPHYRALAVWAVWAIPCYSTLRCLVESNTAPFGSGWRRRYRPVDRLDRARVWARRGGRGHGAAYRANWLKPRATPPGPPVDLAVRVMIQLRSGKAGSFPD